MVIDISKDKPEKSVRFRLKHNLTCLLGSSDDTKLCEQFGVWVKNNVWKNFMGIRRSFYLFDIKYKTINICFKVKVDSQAQVF